MADIIYPKEHCCCFTGHRPEKLTRSEFEIRIDLETEIQNAIADGFTTFVTGMAKGVDLWSAEIVLRLRNDGQPIHLVCAIPYAGFEAGWSADWQQRYRTVLHTADAVNYVCVFRCRGCYHIRNRWLVDHSSRVIAVYNGQLGGTKNTINYAGRTGVPVHQLQG